MDAMYNCKVRFPYRAQNKDYIEVDPSAIYASYLNVLGIKMERYAELYEKKHFAIHEEVIKFAQFSVESTIKGEKIAAQLIRKYNDMSAQEFMKSMIRPPLSVEGTRQAIDAN